MNKKNAIGESAFDEYYKSIYLDRWSVLKKVLLSEKKYYKLENPFLALDSSLEPYYLLDEASIVPADVLNVLDNEVVCDMCSAPGGKALRIFFQNPNIKLYCNEVSQNRRYKLQKLIQSFIPQSLINNIFITGFDGAKLCLYQKNFFDKVLLDAPCSMERHILNSKKFLNSWSKSRLKNVIHKEWALISSAIRILKTNGSLVYSTCSINPDENENMIERLINKYPDSLKPIECSIGEKLKFGNIILPDKYNGSGPIYFCLIRKLKEI
jgi:16S rRNA C967 or C1407 C5-methylase (RsmB/RsmF family)